MRGILGRIEKDTEREIRKNRGWWDEECKEKKRLVRKELKRWRRGEGDGERYRGMKKRV